MDVEYGPTPIENGVPQGTEMSTGVNPGKTNLHLHSDGTPITTWLEELVKVELRLAALEDLLVLELDNDDTAELRLEAKLEITELADDTGRLELTILLTELVAGTAEDNITLELDGATILDELGTKELDETAKEEVGKIAEAELTADELGAIKLELEADEAGTEELEDTITLEEVTGVADDTGGIIELDEIETADTGILLTKLETIELGVIDEEVEELVVGVAELEVIALEILLEETELNKLLRLELAEDNTELKELEIEGNELPLETSDKLEETELNNELDELFRLEEFTLLELETVDTKALGTTDDRLLDEALLDVKEVGVALNITFNGLLHGIVKSKLIAKKLYCTLHVRPSPDVEVWALAFGANVVDNEAAHKVNKTAQIVI